MPSIGTSAAQAGRSKWSERPSQFALGKLPKYSPFSTYSKYLDVLLAGDHGHAGGEVARRAVRGVAHPRLIMVEGVILLHDLLGRRQRDLDGALDDGNSPFLNE